MDDGRGHGEAGCRHSGSMIVCRHIVEEAAAVHRVVHERDGSWQAVCRDGSHETSDEACIACHDCFFARHPEAVAVSGLYQGVSATAIEGRPGRWWIEPISEEEPGR